MSRVHMLVGAALYLAGPFWLLFVALGAVLAASEGRLAAQRGRSCSPAHRARAARAALLGLIATLLDAARAEAHGGALRAGAERDRRDACLAALLAPLLMVHHTRIVLSILLGRAVRWGAQQRRGQRRAAAVASRAELRRPCSASAAVGCSSCSRSHAGAVAVAVCGCRWLLGHSARAARLERVAPAACSRASASCACRARPSPMTRCCAPTSCAP